MQENRKIQTKTGGNVKAVGSVVHKQTSAGSHKESKATAIVKPNQPSSTKKTKGNFLQGCLGCFGLLALFGVIVIVILATLGNNEQSGAQKLTASTQNTGEHTATGNLDSQVKTIITKAVGEKTNMGESKILDLQVNDHQGTPDTIDKIVVAKLQGNDNLSSNMIKGGMQLESIKIFKNLFEHSEIQEVALIWQFPTVNDYGNSELNTVLKITITRAIAEQINWEKFDKDSFSKVADSYWEHPTLRD